MRLFNSFIFVSSLGLLLYGCTQDPLIENNDPVEPLVELDVTSRISGELSIVSTSQSSDFTYGAEIIRIVNGAESEEKFSFTTKELDENHRYSWLTEGLQPNSTYMARSYLTNGRDIKYSTSKTYSTPSTSKPTLSAVTQEEAFLVATIVDNGGRSIEETGFVVGDTPDRKELMRKEKIPASKQSGNQFSLSMSALSGGKTYYTIAYALDDQEDVGYSVIPFEVFVPKYAQSVTLSMTEATLPIEGSITLTVTVSPEDAVDKTVTWESSNPEIASVQDGLVTGLKEGKATIVATVSDISATCEITVMDFIESSVFPDLAFREYVYTNFDTNNDGFLSREEALRVYSINISGTSNNPGIYSSLEGIEFFSNLKYLNCEYNQITELDLSNNPFLGFLNCCCNQIHHLDVSNNLILTNLYCQSNQLTDLDVSKNHDLISLMCDKNPLTSIDISHNPALSSLGVSNASITSIDVSMNPELRDLICFSNQLTSLDVSNNPLLSYLFCAHNQLAKLDVSTNPLLTRLLCSQNQLTELVVSNNPLLFELSCSENQLTDLVISNNLKLQSLTCSNNFLVSIDVTKHLELNKLICSDNQINSLDLSDNSSLKLLWCHNNPLESLSIINNTLLENLICRDTNIRSLDIRSNTRLNYLLCHSCMYLSDIWLNSGQVIETFWYDTSRVTLHYE